MLGSQRTGEFFITKKVQTFGFADTSIQIIYINVADGSDDDAKPIILSKLS